MPKMFEMDIEKIVTIDLNDFLDDHFFRFFP